MTNKVNFALPKNVVWLFNDSLVVVVSLLLTIAVRPDTAHMDVAHAATFGLAAIAIYYCVNYRFHLYHRIWRYASVGEVFVIASSVVVSTLLLAVLNLVAFNVDWFPINATPMMGLSTYVGFVGVRYRSRLWTGFRWRWQALGGQFPTTRTQVLIIGAGEAGQLLAKRILDDKEGEGYRLWIVGFVDDDRNKHGMRIHGIPVRGDRSLIPQIVSEHGVNLIIIAVNNISGSDFRAILDVCEQTPAAIKVIPGVFDLIQGTRGLPPIRNITSEDLLGRKPVEIDHDACSQLLFGKTVLVTGAAGSIGSELCRQIVKFGPHSLIMLDNNESGLHDLTVALKRHPRDGSHQEFADSDMLVPVIGDVTNEYKMEHVFEIHRPQIVFHAAAYKHVPLMEDHPDEAVRVNVKGTRTIVELSGRFEVERFVLVSTDKAVNPYNVMGATKWLCEKLVIDGAYVKSAGTLRAPLVMGNGKDGVGTESLPRFFLNTFRDAKSTMFTAVRFGNVLGSRGSVVPTFELQIDQGGPITVTHPDMTRYFMSISEAASLIVQAAAFTEGNDVFMLDMGQQIRIDELARRLVRFRGLRPEIDIPIIYTGPRPGEKMHEKLLADGEELSPTPHPHIFRIKSNNAAGCPVTGKQISQLVKLAETNHNGKVSAMLRDLTMNVPSLK